MTISIDGNEVTIEPGEYLVFMNANVNHLIKVGTNTFHFNAHECTPSRPPPSRSSDGGGREGVPVLVSQKGRGKSHPT